ncbi:YgfZ/GcvT domain-containing protein [Pseudemcibacter aquimaris]|uniref:CAF17-like 4Fe-4S cluster assembly/insertion protein YgfZ n=1 Tax=Pseudemcibacter aquimaris TaxID=2857064 RepID=UPI002010E02E|nr:hypothetical protein [Pseudemcibacter aquimaris]MCC3862394.1 hypothetical protein [Pseudemcibacter aquimaris]WDU59176.1 hypothetical protein KW060_02695 [Pseudemcibacter aquimaris]
MKETLKDRGIITLAGPDRHALLRGIITNSVKPLIAGEAIYAALLTPQGKFLHDFFLIEKEGVIYLDCELEGLPKLFQKLLMYRLRSNVEIIDRSADLNVLATSEKSVNDICFQDPRNPEMGYRSIGEEAANETNEYHSRRIALGIPEGTNDFITDKSTILEGHFEALNGVDFDKGCYVGQEVIARMKYRGKIKKLMYPVKLSGPAPEFGTEITDENGNKIGDIRSNSGDTAIALFRIDKMEMDKPYQCGDITVTPYKPDWMDNE